MPNIGALMAWLGTRYIPASIRRVPPGLTLHFDCHPLQPAGHWCPKQVDTTI
jgi:hypothetical protein